MWKNRLKAKSDYKADGEGRNSVGAEQLFEDDEALKTFGSPSEELSIRTAFTTIGDSSSSFLGSKEFDIGFGHSSMEDIFHLSQNSFGTFGDFSCGSSSSNMDFGVPFKRHLEDSADASTDPRIRLQANGFSWNKAKVVRMLSSRSLMLEAQEEEHSSCSAWGESFKDDDLSVVNSVGTYNSQSTLTSDEYTNNNSAVCNDHDSDLADVLDRLSQEELAEKFINLQMKLERRRRKLSKSRGSEYLSKRNLVGNAQDGMTDTMRRSKESLKSTSLRKVEQSSGHQSMKNRNEK